MELREYLSRHGISQTAFARRIRVKVTTLHGWLTKRRRPRAKELALIERETDGAVRAADFVEAEPLEQAA